MPGQARLDAPGTLHHVIVRGIEKRRIVDDRKDRENFVKRMGEIASDISTTIYAWALVRNHSLCGAPHKKRFGTLSRVTGKSGVNRESGRKLWM